MHLTKHHALGNDFLVALTDEVPTEGPALARAWCHRTRGVGADGLIFGTPTTDADLAMSLFNSDGSAAEISGNGLRCLAQAAFAVGGGTSLSVRAGGGVRVLNLIRRRPAEALISVEMGRVGDGPPMVSVEELPRVGFGVHQAGTADIGNPHVVLVVDDLGAVDVDTDGPATEALWMPAGINVHFMVQVGPASVELVHWERGAGVTQACGTGATVAATLAHRWGMVPDQVEVVMPGGRAEVTVGPVATLTGPSVHVADIEIDVERWLEHTSCDEASDGRGSEVTARG